MTITINPSVAGALRILRSAGVPVSVGSGGGTLTDAQLEQVIEEIQKTLLFNDKPLFGRPLWGYAVRRVDNTTVGSDGVPGGSTSLLPLSTSYTLVDVGLILPHEFQGQGAINIQACMSVVDSAGAGNATPTFTAALVSRNLPDFSASALPAVRGKIDTSPVTHGEFDVPAGTSLAGSAIQRATLNLWLTAEGVSGSTWMYGVSGYWSYSSAVTGSRSALTGISGGLSIAFDPTVAKQLELHLKCSAPSGTQTVVCRSSNAFFYSPRGGCGYEG